MVSSESCHPWSEWTTAPFSIITDTASHTLTIPDETGGIVLNAAGVPSIIRKRADQTIHPFTVQPPGR
ncbi:hypothetical protein N7533_011279 [Penicillium manginii]|uniref:uncharacterized protein n=1 Tax=Penicillium manginii TaxID=203109 RepID=UPI0025496E98|nr:uncharacterized protein N7533_011279 [Penicillium manginii]KAJ5741870.1 hypothetical protein N7533_011279 [Penicillium manginii]